MEIKNFQVYGLKESILRSGFPMRTDSPGNNDSYYINDILKNADYKRGTKLSSAKTGSGHDNFLKGIIVQFDLKYPQYFSPQLQRYHWIDIISSQSKMHKLTSVADIKINCNKYVLNDSINVVNTLIEFFNNNEFPVQYIGYEKDISQIADKRELFHYIISNLPMGYELWMGVSTNYLQLKTIFQQRKNHKLNEWRYFADWIKTLPNSNLITGIS